MSSEWKSYQLADLTNFKYGKFLAKSQLAESGFPVFSGYGVVGYLPTYQFDEPQLLIVCRGEGGTGDVKMSPQKCSITNLSIVFTPNEQIVSKKYLYWALKASDTHRLRTGSAQAQIVIGSLEKLRLAIPTDKSEQDEISHTLDALDERITLLRETNATLEAIAQTLFKSWFVDFDPVHAKQQGIAPVGLDEATAALFPDGFEESELGLVPRGWKHSTVEQSFILTMGQSPPGDTYNSLGDGLPFYQGRTDFGLRFPTKRIFCNAPTRTAEIGDTLVSVRAPVGDVNMAIERCCLGRGVASVRHPQGYRSFAFYSIRGLRSKFDMYDSEGTVFGSINKKDFQSLPVIQPGSEVLEAFDDIASPLDSRIVENEEQMRTLATLRDTLLPRLISGQLRLPEADIAHNRVAAELGVPA
jgi:type I restriction enzyme S subunit